MDFNVHQLKFDSSLATDSVTPQYLTGLTEVTGSYRSVQRPSKAFCISGRQSTLELRDAKSRGRDYVTRDMNIQLR